MLSCVTAPQRSGKNLKGLQGLQPDLAACHHHVGWCGPPLTNREELAESVGLNEVRFKKTDLLFEGSEGNQAKQRG